MRSIRLLVLAASLAASIAALPAYASGPGAGGGPGGAGGGGIAARPVGNFRAFRMAGALFSPTTDALSGAMQYTLDPNGRARLVVAYFNAAHLPSGTSVDVLADGAKIGSLVTTAQGGTLVLNAGVPRLTLQSRISLVAAGETVASGAFTFGV